MVAWITANLVNIVVVGIVLVLLALAGRSVWKQRGKGGCDCGCSGNCSCCGGCAHSTVEK